MCNHNALLQILIDISSAKEPLPEPLAMGSLPLPPLPAVGEFQFGIIMEADGDYLTLYVAVAQVDVTVYVVTLNVSDGSVGAALQTMHHYGSLHVFSVLSTLSVSLFFKKHTSIPLPVCIVLAYSAAPACTIVVDERCSNTMSLSTCVANTTIASVLSSSIAGVESLSGRLYVLLYSMVSSAKSTFLREKLRKHANNSMHLQAAVYGAVLMTNNADTERSWVKGTEWPSEFGSNTDEPLYLYMGDNPSVTLLPTTNGSKTDGMIDDSLLPSVAFLLSHDSGYCPNSEINNKRADRGVCDILPSTCEGSSILNYAYGSVQSLQLLLQQKEPLSPCHPSFVSRFQFCNSYVHCLMDGFYLPWLGSIPYVV